MPFWPCRSRRRSGRRPEPLRRRRNGRSRRCRSTRSGVGSTRHFVSWAPFLDMARKGPSRWVPSMSGRPSIIPCTTSRFPHTTSIGLVMRLRTCLVVPCSRWPALALLTPSGPSSNERPHAPWAWMSTYPGVITSPSASMTPDGPTPALRQADSKSGSESPTAVIERPSETSHACGRTPRASTLLAPRIANGAPSLANSPSIRSTSPFLGSFMVLLFSADMESRAGGRRPVALLNG